MAFKMWNIAKDKFESTGMSTLFYNYTDMERKVREATNLDPWGPHGTQMSVIAKATYNYADFTDIMNTIWGRFEETHWRHIYKSMLLLDYCIKNGSERVLSNVREHTYCLRSLSSFHYKDQDGKDQGINVRTKAKNMIEFIRDTDRVQEERDIARKNRGNYVGVSNNDMRNGGMNNNRYASNSFASPVDRSEYAYDSSRRSGNSYGGRSNKDFPVSARDPTRSNGGAFDDDHGGAFGGMRSARNNNNSNYNDDKEDDFGGFAEVKGHDLFDVSNNNNSNGGAAGYKNDFDDDFGDFNQSSSSNYNNGSNSNAFDDDFDNFTSFNTNTNNGRNSSATKSNNFSRFNDDFDTTPDNNNNAFGHNHNERDSSPPRTMRKSTDKPKLSITNRKKLSDKAYNNSTLRRQLSGENKNVTTNLLDMDMDMGTGPNDEFDAFASSCKKGSNSSNVGEGLDLFGDSVGNTGSNTKNNFDMFSDTPTSTTNSNNNNGYGNDLDFLMESTTNTTSTMPSQSNTKTNSDLMGLFDSISLVGNSNAVGAGSLMMNDNNNMMSRPTNNTSFSSTSSNSKVGKTFSGLNLDLNVNSLTNDRVNAARKGSSENIKQPSAAMTSNVNNNNNCNAMSDLMGLGLGLGNNEPAGIIDNFDVFASSTSSNKNSATPSKVTSSNDAFEGLVF